MEGAEKLLRQAFELLDEGEYAKALSKFDRVIKEDPSNAQAYYGKAEAGMLVPKATSDDIMAAYRKAIELDPENAFYLVSLGAFCIDEGRFNEAEEAYNRAAEIDKDNAPSYYSEFAVGYFRRAPEVHEQFLDQTGMKIIQRKALKYLLKSIGLDEEKARDLLQKHQ